MSLGLPFLYSKIIMDSDHCAGIFAVLSIRLNNEASGDASISHPCLSASSVMKSGPGLFSNLNLLAACIISFILYYFRGCCMLPVCCCLFVVYSHRISLYKIL